MNVRIALIYVKKLIPTFICQVQDMEEESSSEEESSDEEDDGPPGVSTKEVSQPMKAPAAPPPLPKEPPQPTPAPPVPGQVTDHTP